MGLEKLPPEWQLFIFNEIEKEHKRRYRKSISKKKEAPIVELESFEVKESEILITLRNIDNRPANIFSIDLMKVLKQPRIESHFLDEKIKVWERIDKGTQPETFTILQGKTFTCSMRLTEPLEVDHEYMLELRMGTCHEPHPYEPEIKITKEVGWGFLLNYDGKEVKKVAMMNFEQAEAFWRKIMAQAEKWLEAFPRKGKKLLLLSFILGLLFWLGTLSLLHIFFILTGFIGLLLVLKGWRSACKGKSGFKSSLIGGILLLSSLSGFAAGILAIIGGFLSKKPTFRNK